MTSAFPMAVATTAGTGLLAWVATAGAVVAVVPAGLRWLRVAQREHYLAGAGSRFARRWWLSEPADVGLLVLGVAGLLSAVRWPVAALAPAAVVAVAPLHLSVRGRSSRLVATPRLRRLATTWVALQVLVVVLGVVVGAPAPVAAAGALLVPALVDAACALTAPFERRAVGSFVTSAAERLGRVRPRVVAITGSYGKTSTKNHIAYLLAGTRRVVATPASYNNRAGLARSVNEQLVDGTEVFVAEMGTYGPGEIAELCGWCPPDVAVITAIGPVHLERFGSEDRIASAKEEITRDAGVVVLNVDDRRLAEMAARIGASGPPPRAPGQVVVRCSALDVSADVCVRRDAEGLSVWRGGRRIAHRIPASNAQPGNLACAVAVALQVGLPEEAVGPRLAELPDVPSRLASGRAASGVLVIDDTFNSNPAGARAALAALGRAGATGRRVVVTPGMVELGPLQGRENREFAAAAAEAATDVLLVGRTNRRALLEGAAGARPTVVGTREEAVAWVRANLGDGDVVLYENDLPDHYP